MDNINWLVFKQEEKSEILLALKNGDYKNLVCIITGMGDMTPEKEVEIQKMVDLYSPVDDDFESEIQGAVDSKFIDAPHTEQSPEVEAKWQKKLDDEKAKYIKKQESTKAERLKTLETKKEDSEAEATTVVAGKESSKK